MTVKKSSLAMQILRNYKTLETITLDELIPNWWGKAEMV